MANRLLRLTVHDPVVIKALDALRKTRKQSAFVVEALKHFLGTTQGQEQFASYLATDTPRISDPSRPEAIEPVVKDEPSPPQETPKTNLDDIFKF
jgi:hypothetical protein